MKNGHSYRVWCKEKNEWERGLCVLTQEGKLFHPVGGAMIQLREETHIVEFDIGRKDQNGKPIFDGDIVRVFMSYDGGTLPHLGVVVYDETFCGFATRNEAGNTPFHNHCLHTMVVIGNIHDNPGLLEVVMS